MKAKHTFLTAALLAGAGLALVAAPQERVLAADEAAKPAASACLQNDLIWNFNVVNQRELQVIDRNDRVFTVKMTGGCIGLTNLATLSFRTRTSLGCLQKGDRVAFREPTLGAMSCTVTDVQLATAKPSGS
jgi:hypothetical protein